MAPGLFIRGEPFYWRSRRGSCQHLFKLCKRGNKGK